MIPNAKKILIETEQSETFVVRLRGKTSLTAFCEKCGAEGNMLDLDSAVNYSGRSARTLMREIESGAIHSAETESGHLLICVASLIDVEGLSNSATEE